MIAEQVLIQGGFVHFDVNDPQQRGHALSAAYSNTLVSFAPQSRQAFLARYRSRGGGENPPLSLVYAQEAARATTQRKIYLACLPKSGSSFLKSALVRGLGVSFWDVTLGPPNRSLVGANGGPQEIDELALIKACLSLPGGFVAQHHTLGTAFTVSLCNLYQVRLLVTLRNLWDAIVSADDMMSDPKQPWHLPLNQGPQKIPLNYQQLPRPERLAFLTRSMGIFFLDFALSWLRLRELVPDLAIIDYNTHLARNGGDREALLTLLTQALALNAEEQERLGRVLRENAVDAKEARLNKAVAGRGVEIPAEARADLLRQAGYFRSELGEWFERLFGLPS